MRRLTLLATLVCTTLSGHCIEPDSQGKVEVSSEVNSEAVERGAQRARQELADGLPIVLNRYGKPAPPLDVADRRRKEFVNKVLARHGVVQRDAGCFGPDGEQKGYDDEMYATLNRRYGEYFWNEVMLEVRYVHEPRESTGTAPRPQPDAAGSARPDPFSESQETNLCSELWLRSVYNCRGDSEVVSECQTWPLHLDPSICLHL